MDIKTKQEKLKEIYNDFIIRSQPFMVNAVCKPGCSFCCVHFGHVDIITLEGYIIHKWMETLSKSDRIDLHKKIVKNMKKKKKGSIVRCPFLSMDNTCRIYEIRPFSCRQLYSLETCTTKGPTIHRKSVEMAKMTVKKLQHLDATGYSGHLSYILHLISTPDFKELYQTGGFDPAKIMSFGKKYGIIINRKVSDKGLKESYIPDIGK
jgi:Fe-S-cluster containining protein